MRSKIVARCVLAAILSACIIGPILLCGRHASADAGTVPAGGKAKVLLAGPAGRALCPLQVMDTAGGTDSKVDCSGRITSNAATATDAITVATNGARIHFGAGASDYASSDGTTITFAGPVKAAAGLDLGLQKITSVANGIVNTDAANVGQLNAQLPYENFSGYYAGATADLGYGFGTLIAPKNMTVKQLALTTIAGGSIGSGVGTTTIEVYDITTSQQLCAATVATCALSSTVVGHEGTNTTCTGLANSGDTLRLRYVSTTCSTSGYVFANVTLQ